MKRLLTIIALFPFLVAAQFPVTSQLSSAAETDEKLNGLMVQDYRGVVWLASDKGLRAYFHSSKGNLIETKKQPSALLHIDSLLWVGTTDGTVDIFHPQSHERVKTFKISATKVPVSRIVAFENQTYICTEGSGLFQLSIGDTLVFNKKSGLADNFIYDVVQVGDRLFVASDGGLDYIENGKVHHIGGSTITTNLEVLNGTVYGTTYDTEIVKVDPENLQLIKVYDLQDGTSLIKKGHFLYVAGSLGVFRFENDSSLQVVKPSINTTGMLARDDENLLIQLKDGSLISVNLHFSRFDTRSANSPITALSANTQSLFCADSSQVTEYNLSSSKEVRHFPLSGNTVVSCLYANREQLLVGTFNQGLIRYDLQSGQKQKIDEQNGLPDNNILSISIRSDTVWLSTLSGLSYIAPDLTTRQFPIMETIGSTYIYSVLALPDRILLGTDGKGLYSLQNGTFTELQPNTKLADATIYQLSATTAKGVWISTRDEGGFFLYMDQGIIKSFPELQTPEGYAIIKAIDEKSAVATAKGSIALLDAQNIILRTPESFADISSEYIQNTTADGNGNFYFTVNGDIIKHTKAQKTDPLPTIVIEKLTANGIASGTQEQHFGPDINQIGFQIGLVWYENNGGLQYRYRLSGLDEEWKTANADYRLAYPNLSHGEYELEVQPGLNGIFYEESTLKYRFSIAQYFYLKAWFIIFVILALSALIVVVFRVRLKGIERKRTAERRILESELAILRTQVNPHFLFNSFNTLLNIIESKPAEAGNYLQRLSDFYRRILSANDDQLLTLKQELINLEEYLFLQNQRFGSSLEFRIEINDKWHRSKVPALTLQLLAENAIKHNAVSKNKPLKIHIYTKGQSLNFSNNINPKRNAEPGTGTGLRNIKSRYAALFKKEIGIDKSDSEFKVTLPLIDK